MRMCVRVCMCACTHSVEVWMFRRPATWWLLGGLDTLGVRSYPHSKFLRNSCCRGRFTRTIAHPIVRATPCRAVLLCKNRSCKHPAGPISEASLLLRIYELILAKLLHELYFD